MTFFTFSRKLNFPLLRIITPLTSCSLNRLYVAIKPIGLVRPSSKIMTCKSDDNDIIRLRNHKQRGYAGSRVLALGPSHLSNKKIKSLAALSWRRPIFTLPPDVKRLVMTEGFDTPLTSVRNTPTRRRPTCTVGKRREPIGFFEYW